MSLVDAAGPVHYANVNENTAASNEIVAAVAGKRIRILGGLLVAAGAVTATIEDEDGNDLIGPCSMINGTPIPLAALGLGYQETAAVNKALHLLLSAGTQVGGSITYQLIQ